MVSTASVIVTLCVTTVNQANTGDLMNGFLIFCCIHHEALGNISASCKEVKMLKCKY